MGSLYLFGIPLACLFAFKGDLGVLGLQLGIGVASLLQAILYFSVLLKANWQEITDKSIKRIVKEKAYLTELKNKYRARRNRRKERSGRETSLN